MKKFRILEEILPFLLLPVGKKNVTVFWREVKVPVRKRQPYTRLKVSLWRYDLWKQQYWIHCVIVKWMKTFLTK